MEPGLLGCKRRPVDEEIDSRRNDEWNCACRDKQLAFDKRRSTLEGMMSEPERGSGGSPWPSPEEIDSRRNDEWNPGEIPHVRLFPDEEIDSRRNDEWNLWAIARCPVNMHEEIDSRRNDEWNETDPSADEIVSFTRRSALEGMMSGMNAAWGTDPVATDRLEKE